MLESPTPELRLAEQYPDIRGSLFDNLTDPTVLGPYGIFINHSPKALPTSDNQNIFFMRFGMSKDGETAQTRVYRLPEVIGRHAVDVWEAHILEDISSLNEGEPYKVVYDLPANASFGKPALSMNSVPEQIHKHTGAPVTVYTIAPKTLMLSVASIVERIRPTTGVTRKYISEDKLSGGRAEVLEMLANLIRT